MRFSLKKKKKRGGGMHCKVHHEWPKQLEILIVKHFLSPNSLPIIIIAWPVMLLCKNKWEWKKNHYNSKSCYLRAVEKQFPPSLHFQNLSNHLQSAHILYNTIAYQERQLQLLVPYHGRHCSCFYQFAQIVPDWYPSFRCNPRTQALSVSWLCGSPQMTLEFFSDTVSLP